jgi:hypothetical protein
MCAMRHTISGSDAADDDDIPQCSRCGGLVEDPCDSDDKEAKCELPDLCFVPQPPSHAREGDFWIIKGDGPEFWRRYTNGKWEKYPTPVGV